MQERMTRSTLQFVLPIILIMAIVCPVVNGYWIGNRVWLDTNEDGLQNSVHDDYCDNEPGAITEPGVEGVVVNLYNCQTEELLATTTTDPDGYYYFGTPGEHCGREVFGLAFNMMPGTFFVEFELPDGYEFAMLDAGDDMDDSDADLTGRSHCITLSPGPSTTNPDYPARVIYDVSLDAGLVEKTPCFMGDYVWLDDNENGIQDAGETGVDGVTVNVYDCDDNFVGSTTTDENGLYQMSVDCGGLYYAEFILPDGMVFTLPDQGGDDGLDSDADPVSGKTGCLVVDDFNVSFDAGLVKAPEPCYECKGKIVELTLQYDGAVKGDVLVTQKAGKDMLGDGIVFEGELLPGEEFTIVGEDNNGTLGTEISLYVDDVLNTKIHTSCSKPIGPGLVSGDFTVISGYSREGGLLCPILAEQDDCECEGRVTRLTLQYTGDPDGIIAVEQKNGKEMTVIFLEDGVNDIVDAEGMFSITGIDDKGTLGTEITLYVDGVEHTKIHTSCSRPIGPGLVSGDFVVVSGYSREGGELCPVDPDTPEPPQDGCECKGKVTQLTLQYLGDSEEDITVTQKQRKKKKKHGHGKKHEQAVVFSEDGIDDIVDADGVFTINGLDKGGTLGTEISIYLGGTLHTKIHTSCSKPIGPGLVSGDFMVLDGYSRKGGQLCPVEGSDSCECKGKVTELTLQYNGASDQFIKVSQKGKDAAVDVFGELVEAGAQFSFNGQDKDGTLGTEISIYVGDELNVDIHTSCSRPIGVGMVFGDFEVIEGYSKKSGLLCTL